MGDYKDKMLLGCHETLGSIVNRTKVLSARNFNESAAGPACHPCKDSKRAENLEQKVKAGNDSQRWVTVLVMIFLSIFVLQVGLHVIIKRVIHPSIPTPNTDKLFDEFDYHLDEIVQDTVPFIQDWWLGISRGQSRDQNDYHLLLDYNATRASSNPQTCALTQNLSCLEFYFDGLKGAIATTSPAYVELVLRNLGLNNSPLIKDALYGLLNTPQDLQVMYEESKACLGNNHPFLELTCVAKEYIRPPNLSDEDTKTIFTYIVNLSAVLEALTKHGEKNFQALNEMSEAMVTSRWKEFEHHLETTYGSNDELLEFALAKYKSAAVAIQLLLASKTQSSIPVSPRNDILFQLNILEAVKLDLEYHRGHNAKVGLALAADAKVGKYFEAHEVLSKLGKDFIDAYIAWNFVFVYTSANTAVDRIGKLLIPSISCSRDSHTRVRFIQRRVISLALSLMHVYDSASASMITEISEKEVLALQNFYDNLRDRESAQRSEKSYEESLVADVLGKSNLENVVLTNPHQDTVWKMLYNVCGEKCHKAQLKVTNTGLTSVLIEEDTDFSVYLGFINWLTVLLTGFGLEVFMVLFYIMDGWDIRFEVQWKLAQFLFSILALTTLGLASARNYLSLLTLVLGCWKFGFPETAATMFCALFDESAGKLGRLRLSLDSVGTALHHSSASLLICMMVVGVVDPGRSIFDPILILCMQHWFILLHYYHQTLYITVQSLLEMWFEWTVLSNYEHYVSNHWTVEVAAAGMLLAHWVWLVSGLMNLVVGTKRSGVTVGGGSAVQPADLTFEKASEPNCDRVSRTTSHGVIPDTSDKFEDEFSV